MRHQWLASVRVVLMGLIFGGVSISQSIETAQLITPTPTFSDNSHLRTFPESLLCDRREIRQISAGPSWMGIAVGQATLEHVEQLLSAFSDEYEFIDDDYDIRFIDPTFLHETEMPSSIRLCLQDETVEVIAVAYNSPLSVPRPNLSDLVAQFGLPDAITWTSNPASRVAFWFSQGLAAVVTVIPNKIGNANLQPTFGRVTEEIYFPYQEIEGYENRWPYNQLREFNPFLSWPYQGRDDYGSENPFDFDAMIATITAQPSRTPTPTFVPITSTATAMP